MSPLFLRRSVVGIEHVGSVFFRASLCAGWINELSTTTTTKASDTLIRLARWLICSCMNTIFGEEFLVYSMSIVMSDG